LSNNGHIKNISYYEPPEDSLLSFCTRDTSRCEAPAGSHRCCVDYLAQMLEALTRELGPKIFILFGTLLAYKRYDGKHMIPHDDDLDTGILAEDEVFLKEAIKKLEKLGYVFKLTDLNDQGGGPDPGCSDKNNCPDLKYPPTRYYVMTYSEKNNLHLDIAVLNKVTVKTGEKFLVDAPKKWTDSLEDMTAKEISKYKTWVFPEKFILPITNGTYLDVNMHYSKNAVNLLKYIYGDNYMVPYNRDNFKSVGEPVDRLLKTSNAEKNDSIGLGPVMIINLDKDPHRLHHVIKQCKDEGLYARKVANCCSGYLDPEQDNRFVFNHFLNRHLTNAEKKCFLSHEKCWKKASQLELPSLIVEDDISLPVNAKEILTRIVKDMNGLIANKIIPEATVIRLGRTWYKTFLQVENTCLAYTDFGTGAWAYIVTPKAANKLIKRSERGYLQWPSDHFFNIPNIDTESNVSWETGIDKDYIHLDLFYDHPELEDIKFKYDINDTDERKYVVQELSTAFGRSRSNIPD